MLSARRSHEGRVGALAGAGRVLHDGSDRPDWTRLRAFLDYRWLQPGRTRAAIADKPDPSGSPLLDNLLAGMAEKLSDEAELERPSWTDKVPGMTEPWCTPGTPRMQAAARSATPPQLAARGLTLSSNSLWRDRKSEVALFSNLRPLRLDTARLRYPVPERDGQGSPRRAPGVAWPAPRRRRPPVLRRSPPRASP